MKVGELILKDRQNHQLDHRSVHAIPVHRYFIRSIHRNVEDSVQMIRTL